MLPILIMVNAPMENATTGSNATATKQLPYVLLSLHKNTPSYYDDAAIEVLLIGAMQVTGPCVLFAAFSLKMVLLKFTRT